MCPEMVILRAVKDRASEPVTIGQVDKEEQCRLISIGRRQRREQVLRGQLDRS